MLFSQGASCATTRLKFLGGFGAVWIKKKIRVKFGVSIMYVAIVLALLQLVTGSHIIYQHHAVKCLRSLIYYLFIPMPLPWQPVTSSVKFWSLLHTLCEWEHPISLPLTSVLTLRHTSLEVKPFEVLSTTSALTFSGRFVGIIWFLSMVMQSKFSAPLILILLHQSTLVWIEQ